MIKMQLYLKFKNKIYKNIFHIMNVILISIQLKLKKS